MASYRNIDKPEGGWDGPSAGAASRCSERQTSATSARKLSKKRLPPRVLFCFGHRRHRWIDNNVHAEEVQLTEKWQCLLGSQPTQEFHVLILRLQSQPVNRSTPRNADLSESEAADVADGE